MKNHNSLIPIRRGEGRSAGLLTAAMFLSFAGLGVGAPGVESLFLTRLGARYLPYIYIALGAVTAGLTVLISTVFGRLPRKNLYQGIPLALAAWLIAARILVGMGLTWSYAPIFLSLYVAWTLQSLSAWGAASLVFDARQAKRLFPLFAAGAILGRTLGGVSAGPWARWIGAENLLILWVGALLASFACVRLVLAGVAPPARRVVRAEPEQGFLAGLAYVTGSRLLRRLAAAAALLGGIYFLVVFPFSREVALAFPEPGRLAGFLGLFQGLTTGVAFLTSMFLANRFFARFGLLAGIAVSALIYLLGFSSLAVAGIFPVLVVFRFLELSWMYGFSNTAFQAVFNILPAERREQSRLSVEGVFRQVGVSAAGVLLLAADGTLGLRALALGGAVLAAAAAVTVLLARASYTGALAEALRAGRPEVFTSEQQPFGETLRDPSAVEALLAALHSAQVHARRIAAEILGHLRTPQAAEALAQALRDPSPEVRRQAAAGLGRRTELPEDLRLRLLPLLEDEEPEVRAAAAAALVALGREPRAFALLEQMARSELGDHRVLALQALGQSGGPGVYRLACDRLQDPDARVRLTALEAIARLDAPRSLEKLTAALGDQDPSVVAAAAGLLGTIAAGGGEAAVQAKQLLEDALGDPRREAGALQGLERLPLRGKEPGIRTYALHKLVQTRRYARLAAESRNLDGKAGALLAAALESSRRTQAALALQAVGLLRGPEAVKLALQHLSSAEPQLRANALEVIDSLGDREITREVIAAFESEPDRPHREGPAEASPLSPVAALTEMLHDPDAWVRACALFAAAAVPPAGRNGLGEELERLVADPDDLVRDTALRAVKDARNGGNGNMEEVRKLSMMERILWLQGVPLFAELSPAELKQVAAVCFEARFADGELIGAAEEPGEEMFVIVSGEVRIMSGKAAGEGWELARRGPGDHVGEMSILSGSPRMATMVAAGEVHLLAIARREFEQILRQRPETSLAVMRTLCARLKESQEVLVTRTADCQAQV